MREKQTDCDSSFKCQGLRSLRP